MVYNFSAVYSSKPQVSYADTLSGFTAPELFLHKIFKSDLLELYINTPTTHVAQYQCYNWMKLSTLICWETMSFKWSRAVFIYRYQLGFAWNMYKRTKHSWCTTSVLYISQNLNYDMLTSYVVLLFQSCFCIRFSAGICWYCI